MWEEDWEEEANPEREQVLALLARFAGVAERVRWFSRLGEPIGAEVREAARAYLDALGFPEAEIALIAEFSDAAVAAESLDWDSMAWEEEEHLRAMLTAQALQTFDEDELNAALMEVRARAGAAARIGIDEAAALFDEGDEVLINAAVGAAIQACHQAALVLATGAAEDHPFAHKFRLFEAGRWPVGLTGTSLNLF